MSYRGLLSFFQTSSKARNSPICFTIELSRNTSCFSNLKTSYSFKELFLYISYSRINLRSISIHQLNALPHLHLEPIYLIVFKGSYFLEGRGYLILRGASRLDAFSVYPLRISLPSCAVGTTTVAPGMRPLRSSRTRSSSSHDSFAHDG